MTPRRPTATSRPARRDTRRRAAGAPAGDAAAAAAAGRHDQQPEVRVALDALRHIVQALRGSPAPQAPHGLGSAQLFALQEIAEHPDSSVNDLAALTCTHQSSVSVVIQRLVEQGLVIKVPSLEDRRRQRLAVTGRGRKVLRDAPAAAQGHLIAALAALPGSERRAFAETLRTVAQFVTPRGAISHPPMFFEDTPVEESSASRRDGGAARRRPSRP